MPELPEVESTVRRLKKQLVGKVVISTHIGWKNMLPGSTPQKFHKELIGAHLREPLRRGKYIVIPAEQGQQEKYLILHQKMSGRTKVFSSEEARSAYDHVVLTFDDGVELRMTDPRKFGRAYIVKDPNQVVGSLGPEPLDKHFTSSHFFELLKKRKGALKPLLLNQTFIAGLGNIYVDETLWAAKLHPLLPATKVIRIQSDLIYKNMRRILNAAIKAHGTDFGDGVIYGGKYRPKVYGQSGKACSRCRHEIRRITVAMRGTHICPHCQKMKK